eukprot:gene1790-1820_t
MGNRRELHQPVSRRPFVAVGLPFRQVADRPDPVLTCETGQPARHDKLYFASFITAARFRPAPTCGRARPALAGRFCPVVQNRGISDMTRTPYAIAPYALVALATLTMAATPAQARTAAEITAQGRTTLESLKATEPRSRLFARHARGILVFPSIFKAGLVFGGESGNGVLFIHGRPAGFYNLSGGTWGLQIGGEKFSYVVFFMNDGSLRYLNRSGGFAAGTGPSIAIINKGAGAEANSTTITTDVYAFPFNQKGLMADLTLQGTKISRIHPH